MDDWTRLPNGQLRYGRGSLDDFMVRLVIA